MAAVAARAMPPRAAPWAVLKTSARARAVALVAREGKASTSFIQRHLRIGYNRAATIIEEMERNGVVSAANHAGKREVLIDDDR